jgi:hypothetical protein
MPERPLLLRTVLIDPQEMARRGRLGGRRTQDLHDGRHLAENARKAFNERFEHAADPDEARRQYFSRLGRLSAARRQAATSQQNAAVVA